MKHKPNRVPGGPLRSVWHSRYHCCSNAEWRGTGLPENAPTTTPHTPLSRRRRSHAIRLIRDKLPQHPQLVEACLDDLVDVVLDQVEPVDRLAVVGRNRPVVLHHELVLGPVLARVRDLLPGLTPRLIMKTSLMSVQVSIAHCSSSPISSNPTLGFSGSP